MSSVVNYQMGRFTLVFKCPVDQATRGRPIVTRTTRRSYHLIFTQDCHRNGAPNRKRFPECTLCEILQTLSPAAFEPVILYQLIERVLAVALWSTSRGKLKLLANQPAVSGRSVSSTKRQKSTMNLLGLGS